jgi:hypothetical protein
MKLWLLTNLCADGLVFDAYMGHVIQAESEEVARAIANDEPGGEGTIWEDPKRSSCVLLGEAEDKTFEGQVLSDYNAG